MSIIPNVLKLVCFGYRLCTYANRVDRSEWARQRPKPDTHIPLSLCLSHLCAYSGCVHISTAVRHYHWTNTIKCICAYMSVHACASPTNSVRLKRFPLRHKRKREPGSRAALSPRSDVVVSHTTSLAGAAPSPNAGWWNVRVVLRVSLASFAFAQTNIRYIH